MITAKRFLDEFKEEIYDLPCDMELNIKKDKVYLTDFSDDDLLFYDPVQPCVPFIARVLQTGESDVRRRIKFADNLLSIIPKPCQF